MKNYNVQEVKDLEVMLQEPLLLENIYLLTRITQTVYEYQWFQCLDEEIWGE